MLYRKMLRDMLKHKAQFISIFLMAFLGVYIYAGVNAEGYGVEKCIEDYYEDTNLADVWLYASDFDNDELETLTSMDMVKDLQRNFYIEATADFDNTPALYVSYFETYQVSTLHIVEGEEFDTEDTQGVWVSSKFADEKNLKIGDSFTFSAMGMSVTKTIRGFVLSPEYVYCVADETEMIPDFNKFGQAFLPAKAWDLPVDIAYNQVEVTLEDKNEADAFVKYLSENFKGHYSVALTRNEVPSCKVMNDEIEQHKDMGIVFPIAFAIIAVLTILTTMTRLVDNQRTEIGVLKAMGFKKRKIICHYISYGFYISVIGSVLGLFVGANTLPYIIINSMSKMYILPEWKSTITLNMVIVSCITVLVCAMASYMACRKNLKDMPCEALKPKSPKVLKTNRLERSKLWQKMGFNTQWNLRDITRSKVRTFMTIFGIAGCSALLICAFALKTSIDDMIVWQYDELNVYETMLTIDENVTEKKINEIADLYDGDLIEEEKIELSYDDQRSTASATITDDTELLKYEDEDREYITLPDEGISISYSLAKKMGIEIGDKISWHIYEQEEWYEGIITAIFRTPLNQGIVMNKEYYEDLGLTMTATSIITSKAISDEAIDGIVSISKTQDAKDNYISMMATMNIMVAALIIAAAILAIVVLYNLGVMSFNEKYRELATLKVLGLKTAKIRTLLLTQNIWLTFVGILCGIPIGYGLIGFLISTMSDGFDMMVKVTPITLLITFFGTFIISILVNRAFSKRVRTVDMVSALKGNE